LEVNSKSDMGVSGLPVLSVIFQQSYDIRNRTNWLDTGKHNSSI
jgi:hypothetical protein